MPPHIQLSLRRNVISSWKARSYAERTLSGTSCTGLVAMKLNVC